MIDHYLEATRGTEGCYQPAIVLSELYLQSYDYIWELLKASSNTGAKKPMLKIVYSSAFLAETVAAGNTTYLVYDQYLGQILNRLTRFFEEDAPAKQVNIYFLKLAALKCLAHGNTDAALTFAAAYALSAHDLAKASYDQLALQRLESVAIQERFVIAHELVHFLFREDENAAKKLREVWTTIAKTGSAAHDYFTLHDTKGDPTMLAEEYVSAVDRAYRRRSGYAAPSGQGRQELIAKIAENIAVDPAPHSSQVDTALASDDVLEECVCDSIAAWLVTSWVRAETDASVIGSLRACGLALHHLRLLNYIDELVMDKQPDSASTGFVLETQVRLSLFRLIGNTWLAMPKGGRRHGRMAWWLGEEITRDNLRHSEVLMDQLMFEFAHIVNNALQSNETPKTKDILNWVSRVARFPVTSEAAAVRVLCNFGPIDGASLAGTH